MRRFEARNISHAEVPAARSEIWAVLTDPDRLAEMTPLLEAISTDGDRWCWQLSGISAMGVQVSPSFTERMSFTPEECITFRHEPTAGAAERAGANGVYELRAMDDGRTKLSIDIALHVELPLPAVSKRAVQRVMSSSMKRTGDIFARRLYEHLGVDPSQAVSATARAS